MANVDRPSGLRPVRHLNGMPWNGKARMYYIAVGNSDVICIGDAVKAEGGADASGKYATVARAAATGNLRGVVVGFCDQPYVAVDTTNLYRAYRPTLTAMYCLVVDDPDVIFEVQEDNDSATLAAADVGRNIDLTFTAGNTSSGISGMELDSDNTNTTTLQCRILGLVDREDNELGDYAKWEVLINEHDFKSVTGV